MGWDSFSDADCLNGYPSVTTEFKQRYAVLVGTVLSQPYEPADSYFDQEARLTPSELIVLSCGAEPAHAARRS